MKLQNVSAGYTNTILESISLDFESGKTCVILGKNGSGKTTLLRTIAGIIKPTAGALLDGASISLLPQTVSPVFDIRALELVLTGRYSQKGLLSFETREDRDSALEAMRSCGIGELADRYISALSGGELRKVYIARALCQNANVLLLDEPDSHLDPDALADLMKTLSRLKEGRTIIVTTHNVNFAAETADDVVLLREGRVVSSGTASSTLNPENLRLAFDAQFEVVDREGVQLFTTR